MSLTKGTVYGSYSKPLHNELALFFAITLKVLSARFAQLCETTFMRLLSIICLLRKLLKVRIFLLCLPWYIFNISKHFIFSIPYARMTVQYARIAL